MASKKDFPGRKNEFVRKDNYGALKNGEIYASTSENPGPQTQPPNPPGTITVPSQAPKKGGQQVRIVRTDRKKHAQMGMIIEKSNINPHNVGLRAAKTPNPLGRKNMNGIIASQHRGILDKDGYNLQVGDLQIRAAQTPIERKKARRKNKRQRMKFRRFG